MQGTRSIPTSIKLVLGVCAGALAASALALVIVTIAGHAGWEWVPFYTALTLGLLLLGAWIALACGVALAVRDLYRRPELRTPLNVATTVVGALALVISLFLALSGRLSSGGAL